MRYLSPSPPGPRIVRAADLTVPAWIDNGTAGNGAVTQSSGGYFSIPLAGSKAIASTTNPDPDDAVVRWAAHALIGADGLPLTGDQTWTMDVEILTSGSVVGDNVTYFAAVANESDFRSASIKGLIASLEFTASLSNPRVRLHTCASGSVANAVNGTALASLVGFEWGLKRLKAGASGTSALIPVRDVTGIYSDGGRGANNALASSANGNATLGTGAPYLIFGVYRTLVTDTDAITPTMRVRYAPPVAR